MMELQADSRRSSGRRSDTTKKSPAAFRTISEVSRELDVPQHVLRFWETKFSQIRPMKRGGGRRYYRPEDITLLRGIKAYLYADGYTIRGVQKLLKENGVKALIARSSSENGVGHDPVAMIPGAESGPSNARPLDERKRTELKTLLDDLIEIRRQLDTV